MQKSTNKSKIYYSIYYSEEFFNIQLKPKVTISGEIRKNTLKNQIIFFEAD